MVGDAYGGLVLDPTVRHMDFKRYVLMGISAAMLNVGLQPLLQAITVNRLKFGAITAGTDGEWTPINVFGLDRNKVKSAAASGGGRKGIGHNFVHAGSDRDVGL